MSLKRILGTVLASQMAGRGRSRGSLGGSGLGGLGGFGQRRGSAPGGKAGLAALGFMAFRAYQDHQSRTAGRSQGQGSSGVGTGGGLGGLIQSVTDRLGGETSAGTNAPDAGEQGLHEDERAAEALSDETALLLIRAMVTAAHADGSMSTEERERILQEVQDNGDADDRRTLEHEIENPRSVDELLTQVGDQETAEQFYLASRAAVDGETEANKTYLSDLRHRLDLSEQQAAEIEKLAT